MSGKTRKGSRALRTILIECAHAAAKTRGTYLGEYYRQVARRRGKKKAIVAVAHKILTIVWQLLTDGEPYREAGSKAVRSEADEVAQKRAIRTLQKLGYAVILRPIPQPAGGVPDPKFSEQRQPL